MRKGKNTDIGKKNVTALTIVCTYVHEFTNVCAMFLEVTGKGLYIKYPYLIDTISESAKFHS